MANPPAVVKMALESICLLLGENATDWKAIRSVTMKDNFISTIVNFDTDNISQQVCLKKSLRVYFVSLPTDNSCSHHAVEEKGLHWHGLIV